MEDWDEGAAGDEARPVDLRSDDGDQSRRNTFCVTRFGVVSRRDSEDGTATGVAAGHECSTSDGRMGIRRGAKRSGEGGSGRRLGETDAKNSASALPLRFEDTVVVWEVCEVAAGVGVLGTGTEGWGILASSSTVCVTGSCSGVGDSSTSLW
jgi:hypothetical protein